MQTLMRNEYVIFIGFIIGLVIVTLSVFEISCYKEARSRFCWYAAIALGSVMWWAGVRAAVIRYPFDSKERVVSLIAAGSSLWYFWLLYHLFNGAAKSSWKPTELIVVVIVGVFMFVMQVYGFADKPQVSVEFSVGEIIGGILGGGGALLAGAAYAKKNSSDENRR